MCAVSGLGYRQRETFTWSAICPLLLFRCCVFQEAQGVESGFNSYQSNLTSVCFYGAYCFRQCLFWRFHLLVAVLFSAAAFGSVPSGLLDPLWILKVSFFTSLQVASDLFDTVRTRYLPCASLLRINVSIFVSTSLLPLITVGLYLCL